MSRRKGGTLSPLINNKTKTRLFIIEEELMEYFFPLPDQIYTFLQVRLEGLTRMLGNYLVSCSKLSSSLISISWNICGLSGLVSYFFSFSEWVNHDPFQKSTVVSCIS
ncbi:uncharacterized protein LOC143230425 isoform X1 [Tachypleus tridentatus]|uniref:uncharacterized protein LOC143230425 isoform X1 n=1 Tax=Tachypleus tridentatus TaxID=6853 RepID=UPI003FCF5EE0